MGVVNDVTEAIAMAGDIKPGERRFLVFGPSAGPAFVSEMRGRVDVREMADGVPWKNAIGTMNGQYPPLAFVTTDTFDGWEIIDRPTALGVQ